jgi:hypothetical protein
MARIRTMKPEFFGDEKFAPLPVIDRFVFLGLISMADDAGRLVDNIKTIDGFLFPETSESSRKSLDTLATLSRITRYTSESGQKLIQIANWLQHQKVDRPSRYVLPGPRDTRDTLAQDSRSDLGPTTNDHGPTTNDLRPPTAAARERNVLGVTGEPLDAARNELVEKLGGERAERIVDDFLAASPAASRYAWARGLVAMLDPPGGPPVVRAVLLVAMQDFLVADRGRWPFNGRIFRAFVEDAGRPKAERQTAHTDTGDALNEWARATDEREAKAKVPA